MQYGYKISGFASSERFFETERFLDIYLKGYEKGDTEFSEDGSRRQIWIRHGTAADEDRKGFFSDLMRALPGLFGLRAASKGGKPAEEGKETVSESSESAAVQTRVELVKNVTESAVMVFSDEEIRWLKRGGIFLYLRDLPLMILFCAVYFVGAVFLKRYLFTLNTDLYYTLGGHIITFLGLGILGTVITLLTFKPISSLRTHLRTRFIQLGGMFSVVLGIFEFSKVLKAGVGRPMNFIYLMLDCPPTVILLVILFLYIIRRVTKRRN